MSTKNCSFVFHLFTVFIVFALLFGTTGVTPVHAGGGPFHVKLAATGTGDCLSWANACTLQTALAQAGVGNPVWVMAGTYKPTTGTNRSATFQLRSGVSLYGGFTGTETARDQRDPLAHVTILNGNIGASGNSDNSYHVVTGATGATLDGFTITAGNANGASPDNRGGGMYNPDDSSPTLANIIFLENSASYGGGLYNYSANPMLTNITFIRNAATTYGGGVYNYDSSPTLTNVTFSGNTAADSGGGMFNRENSNPALTNVTFNGNTTTGDGGGMANLSTSSPIIRNTIFWGNTAPIGAQISNANGSLPSVSDSIVQGGYADGVNIIISDPRLGTLDNYGGFTLTIPLLPGSSAIDALANGTNGCGTTITTDQRGVTRSQRSKCDIGAYEYDYTGTYYVKPAASSGGNCQSWANACTLHNALFTSISGDEVWVAAGTHKPTTTIARGFTFQLVTGVAVYGGFTGVETLRSERNPTTNITILSGNINPMSAGSYHVVTGAGGATLDGFTITGGNANGASPHNKGGGLYNYESNLTLKNLIFSDNAAIYGGGMYSNDSDPTLMNVTFSGNSAEEGGGMYNKWGSPKLTDVTFNDNSATVYGGGMYNTESDPILTDVSFINNSATAAGGGIHNDASSPTLTYVSFGGNSAGGGGGMFNGNNSSPTLENVIFISNSATTGGGMNNRASSPALTKVNFSENSATNYGGGIYNSFGSSPSLTNVTFNHNSAAGGGGLYNDSSTPTLTNVTLSSNSAGGGGGVYNYQSNVQIRNTVFWGNTATAVSPQLHNNASTPVINDSVIQNGCPVGSTCSNIISADPLLGVYANHGGYTDTIPLLEGSSAIDKGNDATCADTDQRGVARPQGTQCDIGAYEFIPATFADVTTTYWAWDYIERLYDAGITGGCSTNPALIYCPEKPVTRAQMAIFIERGMNGSAFTPPPASGTVFGDVAASYWAAAWVEQLAADSITGGCGNGNYCPDNPVTRAQMAVFLLKAMHGSSYLPPAVGADSGFADVPSSYWAAAWIKQLAAEGITGGCGTGNYCPDRPVTRAQMAVFLVKAFNLP